MGPARSHCATLLMVSEITFDVVLYLYAIILARCQEVMVTVSRVIRKRQEMVVGIWILILQRQIFTLWTMPVGKGDRSKSPSLTLSLSLSLSPHTHTHSSTHTHTHTHKHTSNTFPLSTGSPIWLWPGHLRRLKRNPRD